MELYNDILLTRKFLLKGNIGPRKNRLSQFLDIFKKEFLILSKGEAIDTQTGESSKPVNFHVRVGEILIAHEFVDYEGDPSGKTIHADMSLQRGTMFFEGEEPLSIEGYFREQAFVKAAFGRRFLIVQDPIVRGLPDPIHGEFHKIRDLSYLIVNKEKIAYIIPQE